jgi:hypothetical protein
MLHPAKVKKKGVTLVFCFSPAKVPVSLRHCDHMYHSSAACGQCFASVQLSRVPPRGVCDNNARAAVPAAVCCATSKHECAAAVLHTAYSECELYSYFSLACTCSLKLQFGWLVVLKMRFVRNQIMLCLLALCNEQTSSLSADDTGSCQHGEATSSQHYVVGVLDPI